MDVGLHYWNFSTPGDPQRIADTLGAAAKTAAEAGFAELSVMDHHFQIEHRPRAEQPRRAWHSSPALADNVCETELSVGSLVSVEP
jgi:alkanesulfonate monooxygenase SsuD/methylene tetrahydromethanopterin reductase-like flavin-dependent oxidoreductase (luciferase family)